jgi:methyltransferase (TIGR00027 family)
MHTKQMDGVGRTGLIPAAVRALEHKRPDRLFADPYAAHFTGPTGFALLSELDELYRAQDITWIIDYFAVRIRYYDDMLARAMRNGIRQVVLPAVGMDCRGYRLDWPADTRVFEIDRAEILRAKQETLDAIDARPRCLRRTVPADLTGSWEEPLLSADYDPRQPSVWVFEGLLCYLPEHQVHQLLGRIHDVCAPGSMLGSDVHNEADLNTGYRSVLEWFSRMGAPFRSASADPARLWNDHGFTARVAVAGGTHADYGRLPLLAPGQVLSYFVCGERRHGTRLMS